jgi:hypothetical protein
MERKKRERERVHDEVNSIWQRGMSVHDGAQFLNVSLPLFMKCGGSVSKKGHHGAGGMKAIRGRLVYIPGGLNTLCHKQGGAGVSGALERESAVPSPLLFGRVGGGKTARGCGRNHQ